MKPKKMRLLVTFKSTAEAMAMEKACEEQGVPGRLIPVPRVITANCGMSWRAELEERKKIEALMETLDIAPEAIHEMML